LDLSGCMPADKRFEDLERDSAEFTNLAAKAREVNSSFLGAGNKADKFVMYDLLGIAWTDLRVRKDAAGILATNVGNWPIREIFVFDDGLPEGKAWYAARLEGREKDRRVDVGTDGYWSLVDFRIRICKSLVEAGLHLDEALCMVKALCGQEAFFRSKGVKAIHLLDSREIENVSRLELEPKPAAVKRAWVMMLWNACTYDGLAPYVGDDGKYAQLLDAIRNSGASQGEIAKALERVEAEKEREASRGTRG